MATTAEAKYTIYALKGPSVVEMSQVEKTGEELTKLVEQAPGIWLAVDFSEVQVIASVALGMLVAVRKLVKERHGRMVVFGAKTEAIRRVMNVTRLNTLFPIVDSAAQLDEAFALVPKMPFWRDTDQFT